jgi:methyl-galactoside transport system permease protein
MAANQNQLTQPPPSPPGPTEPGRPLVDRLLQLLSDNAIFGAMVVVVLAIAGYAWYEDIGSFLTLANFKNVFIHNSTRLIVALGASFAILTAGADLSAGKMVGISAVLSASLLQSPEYLRLFYPNLYQSWLWVHAPWATLAIAVLAAVAVCALFGLLNGWIIAQFGVAPFIATLGAFAWIYGVNGLYFDMDPNNSQPIGGLRDDFTALGTGAFDVRLFGRDIISLPYIVLIALAVAVFMWVLMNKTTFGKNVYAIGGNVNAAKVSGINVYATTIVMYTIAGALYGLGGVLEASRTGGATNNYGTSYELDAIASCVVGGVSVTGGIGTVPGIVVGVLIFGVINYGLTFIGANPYIQLILKGVIIVSAVAFDVRKYVAKK